MPECSTDFSGLELSVPSRSSNEKKLSLEIDIVALQPEKLARPDAGHSGDRESSRERLLCCQRR